MTERGRIGEELERRGEGVMLDLNLNVGSSDSTQNGDSVVGSEKFPEGSGTQMDESGTSNSSIVNAEASSNGGGDDDSCSTRAGDAFSLNFDILKVGDYGSPNDVVTRQLFPMSAGGVGGDSVFFQGQSSSNWIDLSFNQSGTVGGQEVRVPQQQPHPQPQQQQQPVKKSRRGPRSRSSQYRGVTFYRRTGRWESHIWFVAFVQFQ